MGSMKKWMLGAAFAAGAVGLGAAPAQAARIGIYIGTPAAYVPPCPGPGYLWVAGYWNHGYWVPGYWNYRGPAVRVRDWDRGANFYHRDLDRRREFDRDRDRDNRFRR